MGLTQTEKNLLLFLDPCGMSDMADWQLQKANATVHPAISRHLVNKRHNLQVFCFNRRELLSYLFCSFATKLWKDRAQIRKVLFMDEGLLSCFFDEGKTAGFLAFVRTHLSAPKDLMRRIKMFLPPVCWASQRFVVVGKQPLVSSRVRHDNLDDLDFMFFSNAEGKLMLTRADTFLSGHGILLKTAATPEYDARLKKESHIVQGFTKLSGAARELPTMREQFRVNGREYYVEDYHYGESLWKELNVLGRAHATAAACSLLDRLDGWYLRYYAAFTGEKRRVSSFYTPVMRLFTDVYGDDSRSQPVRRFAEMFLSELDDRHEGLIPAVAHNDLWPGNIIVSRDRLTAVDWERATEQSAPLFDYYWMIVSAVMAYTFGANGNSDAATAFGLFLSRHDEVSCQAHVKLRQFLQKFGFDERQHLHFLLLFLMELSVQGYRALARKTEMDGEAYQSLLAFHTDHANLLGSCTPVNRTPHPSTISLV